MEFFGTFCPKSLSSSSVLIFVLFWQVPCFVAENGLGYCIELKKDIQRNMDQFFLGGALINHALFFCHVYAKDRFISISF